MTAISATMVKDLREKTGAGVMDCKAALNEAADDKEASLVEVNSETDFVARNDKFQEMVRIIADDALKAKGDLDTLAKAKFGGGKISVADHLKEMIGPIGENMTLRRSAYLGVKTGVIAAYMHNTIAPGLGKIGVIVALESTGDAEKLKSFGKQVAMHIAAANPQAVDIAGLDPAFVERERAVLTEQAKESGKPAPVIEKMVEGRLRKFYEEVVLLSQAFVHDPETTVAKALAATEESAGARIKIAGFHRFALGEGIDRPDSDFAAEVAAAASGS